MEDRVWTEEEHERHETLAHLVECVGLSVEAAERTMRDDDLWLLEPEMRLEVPDEEAVEQWRAAYDALESLVHVGGHIGGGTMVAIVDAQTRVGIALERARERVRRGRGEG